MARELRVDFRTRLYIPVVAVVVPMHNTGTHRSGLPALQYGRAVESRVLRLILKTQRASPVDQVDHPELLHYSRAKRGKPMETSKKGKIIQIRG